MKAYSKELLNSGMEVGVETIVLDLDKSLSIINEITEKFCPSNLTGHLSIGNDSLELPLKKYEFEYSEFLNEERGYIFFGQKNSYSAGEVVEIGNVKKVAELMYNSYGIEYFLTNINLDYLISVNWYVIELTGNLPYSIKKIIELKNEEN